MPMTKLKRYQLIPSLHVQVQSQFLFSLFCCFEETILKIIKIVFAVAKEGNLTAYLLQHNCYRSSDCSIHFYNEADLVFTARPRDERQNKIQQARRCADHKRYTPSYIPSRLKRLSFPFSGHEVSRENNKPLSPHANRSLRFRFSTNEPCSP